jgi:hypothetical protein
MVKSSNLEELFKKRKKFSPGTLATANTPDITYAEFKKLENETMKLYNASVPPLKQKKGTYEQVKEQVKERVKRLLNKTKLPSLLNPMKRERELVVDGFTPPKEGFTPPKGGYNSQKNRKPKILIKQPRKPKILIKQPRKPKILTKKPRKPNNNK